MKRRNISKPKQDENPVGDLVSARDSTFRKVYLEDTKLPDMQTWTAESLAGTDIHNKYCTECRGYLIHLPKLGTYNCNACGIEYRDNNDRLLSNPSQDLSPSSAQSKYGEDDNACFISFSPDNPYEDSKPFEVIQESGNWKHIKIKPGYWVTDYNIKEDR